MRAMLFTVGTGDGIENAIAFSALSFNADRVYVLCTTGENGSIGKLGAVRTALQAGGLSADLISDPPFEVRDLGDFESTYEDCMRALEAIQQDGFQPSDIAIDYTTGTKVMSAGLVVAALDVDVGHYVYIDGNYRTGEGMRVVSTTEQARSSQAGRLRAQRDIQLAIALFNTYQWDAAIAVAQQALSKCTAGAVAHQATGIRDLARTYRHWDRFEHDRAFQAIRDIPDEAKNALQVGLQPNSDFLFRFGPAKQTDEIELLWARLADLLNNAERRLEQGLNDDAIQRAYRATELLAQIAFAQLDPPLDAAEGIPLDELPDDVSSKWDARVRDDGTLGLGVSDLYDVLADLGNPLGVWYTSPGQEKLRQTVHNRNQTILAHGFQTATPNTVRIILDAIAPKAEELRPQVVTWREQARFVRLTP